MHRSFVTRAGNADVGSKRKRLERSKGPVQVVSFEEQTKNLMKQFSSPEVTGHDSEGDTSTMEGSQETILPIEEWKSVPDPIYGSISFPECAWKIIHTPEFQRLADLKVSGDQTWFELLFSKCHVVKQLGASSYAFPNANHSRWVVFVFVLKRLKYL